MAMRSKGKRNDKKVNMVRYHDLVFKAICRQLTPAERIELDNMKAKLADVGDECSK